MRLSHEAEAARCEPRGEGEGRSARVSASRREQRGVYRPELRPEGVPAPRLHDEGRREEREHREYRDALRDVGPDDGPVAAEEGVEGGREGRGPDRRAVAEARGLEYLAGASELPRRVDGEEYRDESRGGEPQPRAALGEAQREIMRKRGRAGPPREAAQGGRNEDVVAEYADGIADAYPHHRRAGDVCEADRAGEYPAARVRRADGQRRRHRAGGKDDKDLIYFIGETIIKKEGLILSETFAPIYAPKLCPINPIFLAPLSIRYLIDAATSRAISSS